MAANPTGNTPACSMCLNVSRRDGSYITEWPHHVWRLSDDQTWPGWSILVLRKHVTEIFEMTPEDRAAAIEEVSRASKILKVAFAAVKMNIELLGNMEPHVHWHIVPRRTDDPAWNRPIWTYAHQPRTLTSREHDSVVDRIRRALPPGTA